MPTAIHKSDQLRTSSWISSLGLVFQRQRWTGLLIAGSSLLFAILQSVCTFFAALDGLRVGIGISSLVLASATAKAIDAFHADWLRVPMIAVAITGSLLNLLVLWQIRRLRNRPAAQWRQTPPTAGKLNRERLQLALSILTLILITLEERQHLLWLRHV